MISLHVQCTDAREYNAIRLQLRWICLDSSGAALVCLWQTLATGVVVELFA
jgi:hypothetical protein